METKDYDRSRRDVLKLTIAAAVAVALGHREAYAATRATSRLFATEVGTGKTPSRF
jgi:hypothetical protein